MLSSLLESSSTTDGIYTFPPKCMPTYPSKPAPYQFDPMTTCTFEIWEWAKKLRLVLDTKKIECEKAKFAYSKKLKECTDHQHAYEMDFCAYRQELTDSCSSYEDCYAKHVRELTHAEQVVRVAEKARKATFQAIP